MIPTQMICQTPSGATFSFYRSCSVLTEQEWEDLCAKYSADPELASVKLIYDVEPSQHHDVAWVLYCSKSYVRGHYIADGTYLRNGTVDHEQAFAEWSRNPNVRSLLVIQ